MGVICGAISLKEVDGSGVPRSGRVVAFQGYTEAIELESGSTGAQLRRQAGGRVLAFSATGADAMYLHDGEKNWRRDKSGPVSAGRFDDGPELTVAPHPETWVGAWTADTGKAGAVTLTGPAGDAGIRLTGEFRLAPHGGHVGLSCGQTMTDASKEVREVCHWGRSFLPDAGVGVIPLSDRQSRFPGKYALYEAGAVIHVRAKDVNVRFRDGRAEVLAKPRKVKLGFDSHAGRLADATPNDTLFVVRFPTSLNRGVRRGRRAHAVRCVGGLAVLGH